MLVLEEDLRGRITKKLAGLKIRKGAIEEVVVVTPGRHEVRLQVAWDDNVKTEGLAATFTAGETRHLQARLGLVRKNLSLEWQ